MRDRKWLPEYSNQSTEALLALESEYNFVSLVLAFEQGLDRKAAKQGEAALSVEELTILSIEALEREVNNGGYSQFFVNTSHEYVPIIIDALSRIGCKETAALTEKAIKALKLPIASPEAVEDAMSLEDEQRDHALEECDRLYFRSEEPIAERLFAFIKANKDFIRL
jgi:hypothetical protein